MTFPTSPGGGTDPAAACAEPGCARSAVPSTARCGIHLAETLRSEGEVIPFEDPDLGGMFAAATVLVRSLWDGIPHEVVQRAPRSEMDAYVLLDPGSQWQLAQFGLDLFGTLLSDEFGAMRLETPMEFGSNVLLRLRVLVPEVDEIVGRLRSATWAMVGGVVAPDAIVGIGVAPAEESAGQGVG